MISKKDIEHLASLARIELSDHEIEKLEADFERILTYIEKLKTAETGGVEPLAHVLGSANVARLDEAPKEIYTEPHSLVEAAPQKKDGYVAVKSVWNRGN